MARPGTFKPGQSGNPSGRPRAKIDIQLHAREHTAAALNALVEALDDPKTKVAAATELLNRAWGKPVQPVDGNAAVSDHWSLHLVAARTIAQELRTERETLAIEGPAQDITEPPADLAAPALE